MSATEAQQDTGAAAEGQGEGESLPPTPRAPPTTPVDRGFSVSETPFGTRCDGVACVSVRRAPRIAESGGNGNGGKRKKRLSRGWVSPKAELPRGSRTREAPAEAPGSLGGGGALRKKKRVPIEVEAREEEDRCYVANVRRLSDEICTAFVCPGCKRKDTLTLTPGESERVFGGWGMVIAG